jgi:hypothetical protein
MDLRTVKYFIWKSGSDMVLNYRLKPGQGEKENTFVEGQGQGQGQGQGRGKATKMSAL